jgi:hypothetical protein
MITECDDIPASIDVNWERSCNVLHAKVHGLVARNICVGARGFGVLSLAGLCTLNAKKRFASKLEGRKVLADKVLEDRFRRMAEAAVPQMELIGWFVGYFS